MRDSKLRAITRDDWDFILKLRNESSHYFHIQKQPLTESEHYSYMDQQAKNPNYYGYIYDNKAFVRILDNDIGIMVSKEYQNIGIGRMALSEILRIHNPVNLFADINMMNIASFKMFYNVSKIINDSSPKEFADE